MQVVNRSASRWTIGLVVLAAISQFELQPVTAHSWIDCFDTNYTKIYDESASYIYGGEGGNGFCEGYGAGYPGRGDVDIGTEYTFKMLENDVEAGTAVCETVDADTYTNTNWRKRLSVPAGQTIYFAYLPNGHIVKDMKAIGTQHGIYWTGEVGSSLSSTLDMTQENLMDGYTLDFDDGNCGESTDNNGNPGGRAGDGKPCIGTFNVPTGTVPGIYSMVWYWTFWLDNESSYVDQSQAQGYFGAAYSTCFEVEVTSGSGSSASTTEAPSKSTMPIPVTTSPTSTPTGTPTATTAPPESISSWSEVDAVNAAAEADPTATSAPVATTVAPAMTTAAPVVTAAPLTTMPVTVALVATTVAPAVTTAAPVVTAAPLTTTPVTDAPIATTTVPPVQTPAPVESTTAPAMTVASAVTTVAPAVTTESPVQTTSTPEASSPIATTAASETDSTSDGSNDEYPSDDTATFSLLSNDDSDVGKVHAASASSLSANISSSSGIRPTSTSSSSVGTSSGDEVQVPDSSTGSSDHSSSETSSSSTSTGGASAATESSFSPTLVYSHLWIALVCIFVSGVMV